LLIIPENVWGIYPPAPLPAQGGTAVRAGGGDLVKTADSIMRQYISRDIQPQIQSIQRQIRIGPAAGRPLASLYNRLGIMLVRSGQTMDAKAAYDQAAGMGLIPAMTNRGNLALIEKDYPEAERWFRQALAREPENQTALRGMEKTSAYRERR
jgi:tetratricopeptide (TPR) repeat protein